METGDDLRRKKEIVMKAGKMLKVENGGIKQDISDKAEHRLSIDVEGLIECLGDVLLHEKIQKAQKQGSPGKHSR